MASASVPDPNPSSEEGSILATRRETIAVVVGLLGAMVVLGVYAGLSSLLENSLTPTTINMGSQLIVQLDSFLTAGWVVAFFYYWSGWEEALRESKRARMKLHLPNDPRAFVNHSDARLYDRMKRQEKELQPTSLFFGEIIFGLGMFIGSAIFAVNAVLWTSALLVVLASGAMLGGAELMIISWFILRHVTMELRDLADKAMSPTSS